MLSWRMLLGLAWVLAGVAGGCRSDPSRTARAAAAEPGSRSATSASSSPAGWCKGNTHVHTSRSADSATDPADVAQWYEARGFDFIIVTDHTFVTVLEHPGRLTVIPGVELTYNLRWPDSGEHLPIHVNALFVSPTHAGPVSLPKPPEDASRLEVFRMAVDLAQTLGGLTQINHPNFGWAVDAPLLKSLVAGAGVHHFEIANEAIDSNNLGGDGHPSTEELWDSVLGTGAVLYGVASDDAHHYGDADRREADGEMVFRGDRGWIMVRAPNCRDAGALRAAMEAGDFYATRGPVLADVVVRPDDRGVELIVEVAHPVVIPPQIRFLGSGGKLLSEHSGSKASYRLEAGKGYVRAVVDVSGGGRAWTRAVFAPGT